MLQPLRICWLGILMCFGIILVSCGPNQRDENEEPVGVDLFEDLVGIDYYEVRRTFDTGVSYDSMGFVQLPEWHMRWAKKDSMLVYSPWEDRMVGYKIYHDHADYFHFARDSWRMITLTKDSVILQRLSLNGLRVDKAKSNVYMKFYSADHLKNHFDVSEDSLGMLVERLRLPSAQDSIFVWSQIRRANQYVTEMDSAFASVNYAQLKSKHPALTVTKRKIDNFDLTEKSPAYEYLYPEYQITIDPAYRNFRHDFSVNIDEHGKMQLLKVYVMEDFQDARERVVEGVIDVYLHNWLEIIPAHTLGIPHSSTVYLYVRGRSEE